MPVDDRYREALEGLEVGDQFRVDCHDKTLRVHSTGPFSVIIVDAYDEDGAQWPVAEVDGQLYLGWSQLTPADRQTRVKEIGSVEVVGDTTEQSTLVTDGGTSDRERSIAERLDELQSEARELRQEAETRVEGLREQVDEIKEMIEDE